MLIQVTTRCDEQCPHCMHRCAKDGHDMTMDDFRKSLKVSGTIGSRVTLISGGEPLQHPNILTMLRECIAKAKKKPCFVVLATNFLPAIRNGNLWHRLKLLKQEYPLQFQVQVTADKRFYRSWEEVKAVESRIEKDFSTEIEWTVPTVKTVGRAWDVRKALEGSGVRLNWWNGKGIAPMCSNPLLAARQTKGWIDYTMALESGGKYCSMMVDAYGKFHISESMHCPSYSTLDEFLSDPDTAFKNLRTIKGCGRCPINSAARANEMFHIFEQRI